jgi:hypothetical protein
VGSALQLIGFYQPEKIVDLNEHSPANVERAKLPSSNKLVDGLGIYV